MARHSPIRGAEPAAVGPARERLRARCRAAHRGDQRGGGCPRRSTSAPDPQPPTSGRTARRRTQGRSRVRLGISVRDARGHCGDGRDTLAAWRNRRTDPSILRPPRLPMAGGGIRGGDHVVGCEHDLHADRGPDPVPCDRHHPVGDHGVGVAGPALGGPGRPWFRTRVRMVQSARDRCRGHPRIPALWERHLPVRRHGSSDRDLWGTRAARHGPVADVVTPVAHRRMGGRRRPRRP
jgi:hypothetical protein